MLASLLLIAIFLMTFRWFIPRSVLSVASAIPCILIAGIVAMNFFEPAAQAFARSSGPFGFLGSEADFVFFVTMFAGFLALMLNVSAAFPQQSKLKEGFEIPARVVLSVMASYLIMSIPKNYLSNGMSVCMYVCTYVGLYLCMYAMYVCT